MIVNQDGIEFMIRLNGSPPRATLTLPPTYANGCIEVTADDCSIDIDPIGYHLTQGHKVILVADSGAWHSAEMVKEEK